MRGGHLQGRGNSRMDDGPVIVAGAMIIDGTSGRRG